MEMSNNKDSKKLSERNNNKEMKDKVLNQITAKTRELQELLSTIDRTTAIPAFLITSYASLMCPEYRFDRLVSRVKQVAYLIRLLLNSDGHCDISTEEVEQITNILNDIQALYSNIHDDGSELKKDTLTEAQKKIIVAQACFANVHYNTELLYQEQELDRIKRVFMPFDKIISKNEGYSVQQLVDFYVDTNRLVFEKASVGVKKLLFSKNSIPHSISFISEDLESFYMPLDLYKDFLIYPHDYTMIDQSLAEKLLNKFSLSISNQLHEEKPIYYCQVDNPLINKPLIEFYNGGYILLYNIQLATAIYHYHERASYINPQSLSRAKARAVEEKSHQLLSKLDKNGQSFINYSITPHGKEKDLLFVSQGVAFIVECKSNKMIEYSRDTDKAYLTISRNFNDSIKLGFEQAKEVEAAIRSDNCVKIYKKDSDKLLGCIDTSLIDETHIIIVSQERYSLIQNNPALLLHNDMHVVPSCFCIDDLETIILTFCRFENPFKEFCAYLNLKEQLSSRMLSLDELDFAGKFLIDRNVVEECIKDNHIYRIEDNDSQFFDVLYNQFCLGFDNELPILGKHMIDDIGLQAFNIGKRIGLNFSSEEETACLNYALTKKEVDNPFIKEALLYFQKKDQGH